MNAVPKSMPRPTPQPEVVYPESDGKPMADNTKQYRWIRLIEGNLSAMYRDDPNVFIAGDLLWYPVEGFNKIVNAPDVMVVFGRPKGDRTSYLQWQEGGIGPQVVFEILSHSNTPMEMLKKQWWYADHGVQEYYVFDPEDNSLLAYRVEHDWLRPIRFESEHVSNLLKIRFVMTHPEMSIFYPDGRPFLSFDQLEAQRAKEQQLRLAAEQRADDEAKRANDEAKRADDEAKRADDEAKRANDASQRLHRVLELARKVRLNQASDEEIHELEQLETQP